MARKLEVEIVGDDRSLQRALGRAGKQSDSFGGKLGRLGKTAGFVAGGAGLAAVGFAIKDVIGDMAEGQKVTAQTNAVIRSTGDVSKVSAKHVTDLATSIAMKSGIDDEAVQSGENMLLTFTNIRNEVGKGNDVFDQSTKVLADMSTALGQDMSKSAIQLGKALNDPIKGVTALQRVGVTFTDAQKAQIKALVDSGRTMDAQRLILHELNKEFGGSAEAAGKTLPGQLSIAKMAFENWAESMITKAMPAIQNFIATVKQHIPEARAILVSIGQWVHANLVPIFVSFGKVALGAIRAVANVLRDNWPDPLKTVLQGLQTILHALAVVALPVFKVALDVLVISLKVTIAELKIIVGVVEAVVGAFKAIVKPLTGPVLEAVHGINSAFQHMAHWVGLVVQGVKDLVGWLGKIHVPKIHLPSVSSILPGDPSNPNATGPSDLHGASEVMRPFANQAARYGLHITAGRNDHSKYTSSGHISDHWYGKALDEADGPANMAAFFRSLIGNPRVKQAFYDPLGSIFGGKWSSYREGGHMDHVHVATYDRGGVLPPGLTLALNGTGRPERVITDAPRDTPSTVVINFPNYIGTRDELERAMRQAASRFELANGRGAF